MQASSPRPGSPPRQEVGAAAWAWKPTRDHLCLEAEERGGLGADPSFPRFRKWFLGGGGHLLKLNWTPDLCPALGWVAVSNVHVTWWWRMEHFTDSLEHCSFTRKSVAISQPLPAESLVWD